MKVHEGSARLSIQSKQSSSTTAQSASAPKAAKPKDTFEAKSPKPQVSLNATATTGAPGGTDDAKLKAAKSVYIHQGDAEKQVGGDGKNNNCGPTSLTMALRAQGLEPRAIPGLPSNAPGQGTAGAAVQAARYAMYKNDPAKDGVVTDKNGNATGYAQMVGGENSTYGTIQGMIRGATDAGAKAEQIKPSNKVISEALANGASVCVLGNFSGANGAKKGLWPHADGVKEHWLTVTGTTSNGNYIVNDPANPDRAPVEVTPQQLQSFIGDKGTAVSVKAP